MESYSGLRKQWDLPELTYKQCEFMLYVELKNKNWGDASWVETMHDTTHEENKLLEFCYEHVV